MAAAPLACGGPSLSTGPRDHGDPRLAARPGTPTETPTPGSTPLGLGTSRDGLLYVPSGYSADTPAPLLVLLHGAGGQASNWVNYEARAEARSMVLLAPDSRSTLTWDVIYNVYGDDVDFMNRALAHTFAHCNVDPDRILLGGFSDGATYALSLGVSNGDLFTHLIGFSPGFLLSVDPIGKPRVFISHGRQDGVLPVANSRDEIVPRLRADGYDVTYVEFDGTHQVPATIGESALDWFEGV